MIRRFVTSVALVGLAGHVPAALGGYGDGVSATEKLLLPRFCWAQMGIANADGPEFNIPPRCGPGMNHLCPGLVTLMRAKKTSNKGQRLSLLGSADGDMQYTLKWMTGFPDCPLRSQVEAYRLEIRKLRGTYTGGSPATSTIAR